MAEIYRLALPYNRGMPEKPHILDLDAAGLAAWAAAAQLPGYRAAQIQEWIFRKHAPDFGAMSNLPAALRGALAAHFNLHTSTIARRAESKDGTIKWLLRWPDAATSECVMIPDGDRRTACIGSQVGCPVGCTFCASGLEGVERNLTTGEIIEQLLRVAAECDAAGERLSNVVFMGSGEPLANYANVLAAIRAINAPWGMSIAARKITLSTVGLPSQIRRLAAEELQINLALSLHAPNDALRKELIPWAAKIPLAELLDACRFYFDRTGREITLEYILLDGVNDRSTHAEELARFTGSLRCNVNLIRYNPVSPLPFGRPTSEATQRFQEILRRHGVNAHLRKSRGMDIDAACGQLRRREKTEAIVSLGTSGAN